MSVSIPVITVAAVTLTFARMRFGRGNTCNWQDNDENPMKYVSVIRRKNITWRLVTREYTTREDIKTIDKKCKLVPPLSVVNSRLHIIESRVTTRSKQSGPSRRTNFRASRAFPSVYYVSGRRATRCITRYLYQYVTYRSSRTIKIFRRSLRHRTLSVASLGACVLDRIVRECQCQCDDKQPRCRVA